MSMWNPWRGCKKCSDGCLHCYIHKGDYKRGINTNDIIRTKDFGKPIEKLKNGSYKMKSGMVYLCFATDFLIEEADEWRDECWKMIRERQDCTFLFLTKRIDRFLHCVPKDWEDGYDNVVICCTIENQRNADYKLPIFQKLPIKYHFLILQDGVQRELCSASTRFLCCKFAGKCFTGTLWGMYAESLENSRVIARFGIGL